MALPEEVNEVIATLRLLPQSWLADQALAAARAADGGDVAEGATPRSTMRARRLLTAIRDQVDADVAIVGALPVAMNEAFTRLSSDSAFEMSGALKVVWVDEAEVERLYSTEPEVLESFRRELRRYINALITGLDGPPPTAGGGMPDIPPDEGPRPGQPVDTELDRGVHPRRPSLR